MQMTQPTNATKTTDFRRIDALDAETLQSVLTDAAWFAANEPPAETLGGTTVAMVFEQPSTRTRVSFQTGIEQLGGHAQFLGADDLQLDRGEPVEDTARALSCYVDCLVARVASHETLDRLGDAASVPVVNALTDRAHPCQALADLLTIEQTVGLDGRVAWVGDGNNVCASLLRGAAMLDVEVAVATPPGAEPSEAIADADRLGRAPLVTNEPREAVADADAVYTDVWTSMSDETSASFGPAFRVDDELLSHAANDAVVMHCLPAHRGEEITSGTLDGPQSVVWQQAENRLHAQNALLCELLG